MFDHNNNELYHITGGHFINIPTFPECTTLNRVSLNLSKAENSFFKNKACHKANCCVHKGRCVKCAFSSSVYVKNL